MKKFKLERTTQEQAELYLLEILARKYEIKIILNKDLNC